MPQAAAILFCDRCEAATARFERDWLAHISCESYPETHVMIVCPGCAERNFGEDEVAESD